MRFIPISTLKDSTVIINYCKTGKMPIYITYNDVPEMVIMDADFFDKYLARFVINGEINFDSIIDYMPEFIDLEDLKNTEEVRKLCSRTKNAVHILKSHTAKLVIMSLDVYDRCIMNVLKIVNNNF